MTTPETPSLWEGAEWSVLGQHHGLSRATLHVQALKNDGLVDLELDGPDGRCYATLTPSQARTIAATMIKAANLLERDMIRPEP